ncbi:MAG: CoA transferase [Candidatus Dormibacteraeota bacterium]|uniref:CoA transferase n=1 Tax=Candidatus Aeolococcus gillhamiae TaxID=3127015 RepID=A0A934JTT0_9BACT|nr:CoA transferase [Candidatus Dormibacteraeota bacterium]
MTRTLDGVRVLEIGQYIAGPYCAMLLADQGAEVIKVERPDTGDPRRWYDPLIEQDGRSMSGGFLSYNRNKRAITLNLQHSEGRRLFLKLVESSDVVVENLRPGALDRAGLGYDRLVEINPRLIYCAITGFGRLDGYRGPYADRPAFDAAVQAMSGIMSVIGSGDDEPTLSVTGFADIYTAVFGALGVSLALFAREKTGRGTFIDQAMYDTVASLMERSLMLYEYTGEVPTPGVDRFAPVGALKTLDGHAAVIIPTDDMWVRFCTAIGRGDLLARPELATVRQRSENFRSVIRPEAELWSSQRTRAEVVAELTKHGLPAGEVQKVDEVYACPQLAQRQMFLDIDDGVSGAKRMPRTPLLFSDFELPPHDAPPQLGADTELVLRELAGARSEEIQLWRRDGVI